MWQGHWRDAGKETHAAKQGVTGTGTKEISASGRAAAQQRGTGKTVQGLQPGKQPNVNQWDPRENGQAQRTTPAKYQ